MAALFSLAKKNGLKINIKQTAADLCIPYLTLCNWFLNLIKLRHEAHAEQQFHSEGNEQTLIQWLSYLGASLHPVSKEGIRAHAQSLHPENKKPSHTWVQLFLGCHPEILISLIYFISISKSGSSDQHQTVPDSTI